MALASASALFKVGAQRICRREASLLTAERNLQFNFKEAQKRVQLVKFIAEAYNYKLIHTDTLFDLLYRLINYDIKER